MKLFLCKGIFLEMLISKVDVKMNFRVKTKTYATDLEI